MLGDSLDREKDIGGLRSQERVKDEKREREGERQRMKIHRVTIFNEHFLPLQRRLSLSMTICTYEQYGNQKRDQICQN